MPQIIVKADRSSETEEGAVMLRERVSVADFESNHFARHLVERLGWAVGDAHELERGETVGEEPDQDIYAADPRPPTADLTR